MVSIEQEIAEKLRDAGISAHLAEARQITAAAVHDDPAGAETIARDWCAKRISGLPLAYILGRERFMGLELVTDPGALVPRPETELLGQAAIQFLEQNASASPNVIDMCCGSGNLACAIAHHVPGARVWASDLTDGCVSLARRNATYVGVDQRVQVFQGDLFTSLANLGLEGTIDLIVCNPPYISQGKLASDRAELLQFEPREAFDGGPYGLSIHQRVIREALAYLKPDAPLLFEIGLGQERQVKALFERTKAYGEVNFVTNAEGQVRVVWARKSA